MKIKIKYHNKKCKIEKFGDWIDLKSSDKVVLKGPFVDKEKRVIFDSSLISLGISMQLPKYYEANVVPRSSTFNKYSVIQGNHFGVIDNAYSGNNDIWKMKVIAFKDTIIEKGDRICQFRINLSQNAPWYIKLKWLFFNKIEFEEVDKLENADRGGFGSTNLKNN